MPTTEDFRAELRAQIDRAARQDRPHLEVNAGELHRVVVADRARYSPHTRSHLLLLRDEIWSLDEVEDVTARLQAVKL